MEGRATDVGAVRLPVEVVELLHLKTRDGQPVRVECEAIDELVVTQLLETLPGDTVERIRMREQQKARGNAAEPATLLSRAKVFERYAPALIETGTLLRDADGKEVRPAFWFDPDRPRHPLSIPGRLLRFEDKVLLVETVTRLSGYGGGAAAQGATFHAGEQEGRPGGVGAVPPGEDVGADSVAGPA